MKAPEIITGCSSFNEARWKGVFYPEDLPRTKWFDHYCRFFDTYEMNGTFYKFPIGKSLANWYLKAPKDFKFAVKMYKGVTHFKKFRDCEREIADFYTVCLENLKEKLSTVLFQLPPSFSYTEERLKLIIDSVDKSFVNVVEFRHESWWRKKVYDALSESKIIFCNVSYPGLPENIVATTGIGYIRLHGNKKLFYSGYDNDELTNLQKEILPQDWKKTFVYFNNTASTEGILNALEFDKLRK